jgi:two-component system, chemotaxis family, chemotaxis protein CheY
MKIILSVDDSASIRQMVKMTLGEAGYTVLEAGDGAQGLAQAKAKAVDAIITDLNMPVMDGMTFVREVRKLSTYVGVPILLLTTESDAEKKAQAKAAGATGWITKPFQPQQLLDTLKKVIG